MNSCFLIFTIIFIVAMVLLDLICWLLSIVTNKLGLKLISSLFTSLVTTINTLLTIAGIMLFMFFVGLFLVLISAYIISIVI